MSEQQFSLEDLQYLMSRLRKPETGCPWDLKQSYRTICASTIEEAYEVVDAIEHEDYDHLKEELGDLLFQVIFYSQLANEENRWAMPDVVHSITEKLLRRHPHVFPDGSLLSERDSNASLEDADIKASWEKIKSQERGEKGKSGILDDVPRALPAMTRAAKLQKRAAQIGFDWPDVPPVIEKLEEEICEFKEALDSKNAAHMEEELGDMLFTCVNIARKLGKDPETLLRNANSKFETRFRKMETRLPEDIGEKVDGKVDPETLDKLWEWSKTHTL